jgi:hypothetical protein
MKIEVICFHFNFFLLKLARKSKASLKGTVEPDEIGLKVVWLNRLSRV